jgi:hypothetical protein
MKTILEYFGNSPLDKGLKRKVLVYVQNGGL